MKNVLITGVLGQVGSDLREALARQEGINIIGIDIRPINIYSTGMGKYMVVDVLDRQALERVIDEYNIDTIFHLVSILSANGEKDPDHAWEVNVKSLKNVLDIAKDRSLKVFWPSSIAVFGPSCPKHIASQFPVLDPKTMYGITKMVGEMLCLYYFERFHVDVRSLRYPGLISYKTPPGGGTTDYAVDIFYHAVRNDAYLCFLKPGTRLPMMYMDDAIRATLEIMDAEPARIKIRTSYNIAAINFTPEEITAEIRKQVPGFQCDYKPDHRQAIADSWPDIIDDSHARNDWGWQSKYDLSTLTGEMLNNLARQIASERKTA